MGLWLGVATNLVVPVLLLFIFQPHFVTFHWIWNQGNFTLLPIPHPLYLAFWLRSDPNHHCCLLGTQSKLPRGNIGQGGGFPPEWIHKRLWKRLSHRDLDIEQECCVCWGAVGGSWYQSGLLHSHLSNLCCGSGIKFALMRVLATSYVVLVALQKHGSDLIHLICSDVGSISYKSLFCNDKT